ARSLLRRRLSGALRGDARREPRDADRGAVAGFRRPADLRGMRRAHVPGRRDRGPRRRDPPNGRTPGRDGAHATPPLVIGLYGGHAARGFATGSDWRDRPRPRVSLFFARPRAVVDPARLPIASSPGR